MDPARALAQGTAGSITAYYTKDFMLTFVGLFVFSFVLHLITIKRQTKAKTTWFDRFKSASTSGALCFLLHLGLSTILPLGWSICVSVVTSAIASDKLLKLIADQGTKSIGRLGNQEGKDNDSTTTDE